MAKKVLSKSEKIAAYDPSMIYTDNALFGLPFTSDECEVALIPMPWEVTVSFRHGTAKGPEWMEEASYQVDLYDEQMPEAWKAGIAMEPVSKYWMKKNKELRPIAEKCIAHIEKGGKPTDAKVVKMYNKINDASAELNAWMKKESKRLVDAGKLVGVIGGEHSVPYGYMQTLGEKYSNYSILHIDAHADYRKAYEGFEHSHASIQYNAGLLPCVDNQVLLSIRDYSEQEANRIKESNGKITAFSDRLLKQNAYKGMTWEKQCQEIIKPLGDKVYISFDIDALDPSLCPHTGTPVPGGLEYEQVFFLFDALVKSGKKIIGFDLCEVAPGPQYNGEWDAIVGARVLYRLSLIMAKSHGRV